MKEEQLKKDLDEALDALEMMWNQYCPPPSYHDFMSAGEYAETVLQRLRPNFVLNPPDSEWQCEVVDCREAGSCGTPVSGKSGDMSSRYRHLCWEHYRKIPNPDLAFKT